MLCDSNDRSCLQMATVGSLAIDLVAGMVAGVVMVALSLSDDL